MPLPTKTQQQTLDITYNGRPAVIVEAKSLSSTSLDITYDGRPAVGAAGSAPAPSTVFSWWAWSTYGAGANV